MLADNDKTNVDRIGHTAAIPELARAHVAAEGPGRTLLLNDGEPINMTVDIGALIDDPSVSKLVRELKELQDAGPYNAEGPETQRQERMAQLRREIARATAPELDEDEPSEPSDFNAQVVERMANDTGKSKDEIVKELLPGTFSHTDPEVDNMLRSMGGAMFINDKPGAQSTSEFCSRAEIERRESTAALGRPEGFKENNPKDAFGTAKAGITSYLYGPVLLEMSIGMAAGAYKYGAHNYLCVAPRSSVYTDAAIRHILAYVGGEDFDPEAGEGMEVSHITAAMNSLHVLRAAQINESVIDDRPPPMPKNFLQRVNRQMVVLAGLVPEPVARYFAGGRRGPGRIL